MYKVLQVSCDWMVLPNDDMNLGNNEECSAIDSFFDISPTLPRRGRLDMLIWGYLLDVCSLQGKSTQLCYECIAEKPLRMEIQHNELNPDASRPEPMLAHSAKQSPRQFSSTGSPCTMLGQRAGPAAPPWLHVTKSILDVLQFRHMRYGTNANSLFCRVTLQVSKF